MDRRWLLLPAFAYLALMLLACGGYKPPTLGACGEGVPLDEADCDAAAFVANDRCFQTEAAACDCLACPKNRCSTAESGPAQVSCKLAEEADKEEAP
jgi:hypothetical protein